MNFQLMFFLFQLCVKMFPHYNLKSYYNEEQILIQNSIRDWVDKTIKPEIGKTLIWPAEWTHAHKGEVLNSGVKYIITGWMHFPFNFEK